MSTEPKHGASTPEPEHWHQGVSLRYGNWMVWCQCGFLETGWPNHQVAKASLDNHNVKVGRDAA